MTRVALLIVSVVITGAISLAAPTAASAQWPASYSVPVILRDVVASPQVPPPGTVSHPDFGGAPTGLVTGEVLSTLTPHPSTGLGVMQPSSSATTFGPETFGSWFASTAYNASFEGDAPTVHTLNDSLTFRHLGGGVYRFRSDAFDPLHGRGFGNLPETTRNGHFTLQGQWYFRHQTVVQPTLRVCADDSLWIFINDTLVVDMGGVRAHACRQVDLSTLGLQNHDVYAFNIFYADRSGTAASLELTTNLGFYAAWRDDWPPAPGHSALTMEASAPAGAEVQAATLGAVDALSSAGIPRPTDTVCAEPFGWYPVGSHTFHCAAVDGWGNQTTFESVVTVADTVAPTLGFMADVYVEAVGAVTVVEWNPPSATDAVTENPVVECQPASGSAFAVGNTPVTCTGIDDAGNVGRTSFLVRVADTTAPAWPALADVTVTAAADHGATVTWAAVAAVDLVDGALPAGCAPMSGTWFAIGETRVTCTATDTSGNASQTSFLVTVLAPPPPPPPSDSDGDGVPDAEDRVPHSNMAATVSIGACTTRVENRLLPGGVTLNDVVAAAHAAARRHGDLVSAIAGLAGDWSRRGWMAGRDVGRLVSCVARR